MKERAVAFFCMPWIGHFQRMRPLISGLARGGIKVHVFTHRDFGSQVERAGGIFFDLFSKYPLEQADNESLPVSCRFVTFAGTYAKQIRLDVEKIRPSLVVYDSFAVIGRVVATLLNLPRVNLCAGHNVTPERFLPILREDPRVKVSPKCLRAAAVLRETYGLTDASPFSYVASPSPHLNIYSEPPEFLDREERQAFEPIAFYGSIPSLENKQSGKRAGRTRFGRGNASKLKVCVSFGTVVWLFYTADACRALTTLAATFADIDNLCAVISLGGTKIDGETREGLIHSNVVVEDYIDQWQVLQEADVFVTHHGMNSTHEAIFHRVPMISYPFFWDQPGLAKKCRKFGLAIPIVEAVRGEFGKDHVRGALEILADERESMKAALDQAHEWEKAVIADRPAVHQKIVDLL